MKVDKGGSAKMFALDVSPSAVEGEKGEGEGSKRGCEIQGERVG